MVQRIYVDTSVIGGYFDEEFEFFTKVFFKLVESGQFTLLLSDLLATELVGAPEKNNELLSLNPFKSSRVH